MKRKNYYGRNTMQKEKNREKITILSPTEKKKMNEREKEKEMLHGISKQSANQARIET